MRKTLRYTFAAAFFCISLSACTSDSSMNKGPVGIGSSINELKQSPCACAEIPMHIPANLQVS